MNLYAYCGNNSLNFVDPFGQREVPLTHTVTIPITAVTNPYDVTSQNAFTIIDGWLEGTVGFWDDFWGTYEYTEGVVQSRYSEWFLDTVEIDGDNFIITFAAWEEYDDDNLPPTPDFQSTTVGGVIVATLDGIGILDDRLLDDIIRSSVQRVNSWWTCDYWQVNLRWNFWRLQSRRRWRRTDTGECDTPFFGCTSPSQWRYNRSNIKWGSSEINYILEGHAMAHLGIPSDYAWFLVCKWKGVMYGKDPSCGTWYWWNKGYGEYNSRKDW